jgi:GNAT superfamily N-acetyltransferase
MEVLTLGGADVERAAGVIARAFFTDPLNVHLFPDVEVRTRVAPSMFAAYVRLDQLFGRVDYFGDFTAVASWVLPGEAVETPARLAAAGFGELPEAVPLATLNTVFDTIGAAAEREAREPHWHLRLLGVEPELQGAGLGQILLRNGLDRAAASGHPVLLETFSGRNLPFYLRNGFELAVVGAEAVSGLRFWVLRHG